MSDCRAHLEDYNKCIKESSHKGTYNCSFFKNKYDQCISDDNEKSSQKKESSGVYFDPFPGASIDLGGGFKYRIFAPTGEEGLNYKFGSGFYYKF